MRNKDNVYGISKNGFSRLSQLTSHVPSIDNMTAAFEALAEEEWENQEEFGIDVDHDTWTTARVDEIREKFLSALLPYAAKLRDFISSWDMGDASDVSDKAAIGTIWDWARGGGWSVEEVIHNPGGAYRDAIAQMGTPPKSSEEDYFEEF